MNNEKSLVPSQIIPDRFKNTKEVQEVFNFLSTMTPRDIAVMVIAGGLDSKLKNFAVDHLLECTECEKYINSTRDLAVIKVTSNTAVYDFEGDEEYTKLKAAADEAAKALKEYKNNTEPSYYKQTQYFKRSNV